MLQGVKDGDVDALHRTRVASRRLREVLPVLQLDPDVARKLNRPVKLVATRDQGFTIATYRAETRHEIQIGATRRYDGPMGKSDRAFAFGLLALLLGLGVPGTNWLFYVQILLIVLLAWTIVNRARRALTPAPSS